VVTELIKVGAGAAPSEKRGAGKEGGNKPPLLTHRPPNSTRASGGSASAF